MLLVILFVCSVFFFYNLNESDRREVEIENALVDAVELVGSGQIQDPDPREYLIVGDPKPQIYGEI